jgi:signal transduction histidine kinase
MKENLENILLDVSKSPLIDNGELSKAYRLVIKSLHKGLSIKRAGVWFFNTDFTEISCQLLIDTFHETEIEALVISSQDYPLYFEALKSERTILAHDAHEDSATNEFSEGYLTPLQITSMLDVPIRHKGDMIGIICCENIGEKRVWSEGDAIFAGSMADLIGRAINANAFKESEKKLQSMNEELEDTVNKRTAQLLESEKMAALGNLVAGVAHEVNTPLGISITATSTLTDTINNLEKAMNEGRLSEDLFVRFLKDSGELLFLLNNNLGRAADLVQNFKKTAVDHSDQNIHIFNIYESIHYLLISLKPELAKLDVQVELNTDKELSIYSYPSAWLQIVSNLVINSCRHAFENNLAPKINITISVIDDILTLDYSDNGVGIPADTVDKVILPFYTTARGSGGSGLGMSIVYNLITEQLKGTMEINKNATKGFQVIIECPLNEVQ